MTAPSAGQSSATALHPLNSLRAKLRKPFENFITSRSGPFTGAVELNSSRVYILPTRIGMIYSLLLLVLLLGSINYIKSLGFVLTFLLASLGIVGMLMTWRNLAGLKVKGLGAAPVFVGDKARFTVQLENTSADHRYAISIGSTQASGDTTDIQPGAINTLSFPQVAVRRGYLNPGRVRLETDFPLGLFTAWTWVDLSMQCLVYPAPAVTAAYVAISDHQAGEDQADGSGLEDFAGLRKAQPGDSLRRISWKAAARMDELYSKEFTGGQPERQWIDWNQIDEPSLEKRLSIMVKLVLDAQQAGRVYGLRMPSLELEPDNGHLHQHECLKALALYRAAS